MVFIFVPLGTRATIVSVLVGRIASGAASGTVFGLLSIGNSFGAAAGPFLSGAIYDATGSYLAIYLTAAACVAIALICLAIFVRTTTTVPPVVGATALPRRERKSGTARREEA